MSPNARRQRGFTLIELLMTVALAGTLMAIGLPILLDVNESTKLNAAGRELERELQSARIRAVTNNRRLRVRLNCPAVGYYRTVEVLGTAADESVDRCRQTVYPFPADTDLMTRPNYDGPTRVLPNQATVTTEVIEFRPDGTAHTVAGNVAQPIAATTTVTLTRNGKSKVVTINGSGKIQIQH